ncbi:MAG: YaaR family protein [Syntrophomonadaceae bacterium]|nr:YaaR family protein [Syntrophomonadaceae bacterium]
MKIDRDKRGLTNYSTLKKTGVSEVTRRAPVSFEQELTSKREGQVQYKMQELLAEIDKVNERLRKSLTINDLMFYKKLVKDFLKEASEQAFLVNQQRARSRRGRSILITIKTIDSEVEQMIDDFLRNKTEPTEVLEQLDKIRGMLVDLMI